MEKRVKHPIFWFLVGVYICGFKFPFNLLGILGDDAKRVSAWRDFFGLFEGPRLTEAWERWLDPGRPSHDLTNIPIEWVRNADEVDDEGEKISLSWAVKFLCALIVWPQITAVSIITLIIIL